MCVCYVLKSLSLNTCRFHVLTHATTVRLMVKDVPKLTVLKEERGKEIKAQKG